MNQRAMDLWELGLGSMSIRYPGSGEWYYWNFLTGDRQWEVPTLEAAMPRVYEQRLDQSRAICQKFHCVAQVRDEREGRRPAPI